MMLKTKNYGLPDSLIDAVKKVVQEAKLHPNQQKIDVHEPEKDKLTADDFKKLRGGKKEEAKDPIKINPKLKEEAEEMEEVEQVGEGSEDKKDTAKLVAMMMGKKINKPEKPKDSNVTTHTGKQTYDAGSDDEPETPKRKSGPQGPMKRRFVPKSKLRMQFK